MTLGHSFITAIQKNLYFSFKSNINLNKSKSVFLTCNILQYIKLIEYLFGNLTSFLCTKSFYILIHFELSRFSCIFFCLIHSPSVWFCLLPPSLQPHPLPHKRYIWSAWAPPASRWVGWRRPPIAATAPLCATQSATRPWLERTRSGMRWRAWVQMPPAMIWRTWRSGLSIRCGWGHTLMWAQVLKVPRWRWEPKKMVGGLLWSIWITNTTSKHGYTVVTTVVVS